MIEKFNNFINFILNINIIGIKIFWVFLRICSRKSIRELSFKEMLNILLFI